MSLLTSIFTFIRQQSIKTILLFLFIIQGSILKAQQLMIVYEYNRLAVPAEILRFVPQMAEEKTIMRFSLYINKGKSVYSSDSIYIDQDLPRKSFSPWYFKRIYKDYNEDLWVENSGTLKKGYCLEMNINELKKKYAFLDWVITKEKMSIAGVECVKAISNSGNLAWYAPGIPYPDGPEHGVFNLPGLVLWYETPYHQWKAVKTSLEKREIKAPDCILDKNEKKIRMDEMELEDLKYESAIKIDKNTPLKQWLKFETNN